MSAAAAAMLPNAFTPPERNARARGRIAADTWLYTSSLAGRCSAGIQMRSPSCSATPVMMLRFQYVAVAYVMM